MEQANSDSFWPKRKCYSQKSYVVVREQIISICRELCVIARFKGLYQRYMRRHSFISPLVVVVVVVLVIDPTDDPGIAEPLCCPKIDIHVVPDRILRLDHPAQANNLLDAFHSRRLGSSMPNPRDPSEGSQENAQQLQETRKNLEALNKEYESFAHSVSHDLRAPLRGIDMYAGVLTEDYHDRLDDEGRRLLDLIRQLARKMNGQIDDLLKFSRLGRQRMLAAALDMTSMAQSVFLELRATTPGRNVRFELRTLPAAFGDASLIKQVFAHLLSNALKFTGPREQAIIEVTGSNGAEQNTYCVRDNGVGFDPQFAGKLFGIFQRMHPQEEFEGAGVGLALAQRIIQRHGGRIWAEAKEREGATFYFTLPRPAASNETER